MREYIFAPMNTKVASEVAEWVYDEPYSIYSFENNQETIDELMNNNYYAVLDNNNMLLGYFCFGSSARIPTKESNVYTDEALDIGLGIKPELCGKGLGNNFFRAGLSFAEENIIKGKSTFRLTVAEFNQRAIRLYSNMGFAFLRDVEHKKTSMRFCVMLRTE